MKFKYTQFELITLIASACGTAVLIYGAVYFQVSSVVAGMAGCITIALASVPYLRVKQEAKAGAKQRNERVEFNDEGIRRIMQNGETESINWNELAAVEIVTTDDGPWTEDLYWILRNNDGSRGCAIPNASEGFKDLLIRLQSLSGFDNEKVITAMGSTSNHRYLIWSSDASS